jgi:hypothetical protein
VTYALDNASEIRPQAAIEAIYLDGVVLLNRQPSRQPGLHKRHGELPRAVAQVIAPRPGSDCTRGYAPRDAVLIDDPEVIANVDGPLRHGQIKAIDAVSYEVSGVHALPHHRFIAI